MPRSDATYVIRSGVEALGRLELLARLFWPTSERFLRSHGAFEVERFLEVGCGIGDVATRMALHGVGTVVGIDANADVVAAARARADELGSHADIRTGNVADLGATGDMAGFDIAYARCVISHLSDPSGALASMLTAVRPGGAVLVEDVDVAAVWSSPPCDALARHAELYVAAARGLGASPEVGAALPALLRSLGATDVDVDIRQPVLRRQEDIQIHARTMEAIAQPTIDHGLATVDEISELVDQLDAWAATPGVVATLPRIVQVSARAKEKPTEMSR